MKEGEPVLGGPQVPPDNIRVINTGVQPVGFETLQNTQATLSTPPPYTTFTPNNVASGQQPNGLVSQTPTPQPARPLSQSTPRFRSSQVPMQPLRSSQSQPFIQPTSLSTGDIALDTPTPKKSKKWIIGVVLVILCAALAALLLFIIHQDNKIISSQNLDKINEEISDYSGIVMYDDGRPVDLSTSTYNDSTNYKFRREIMSGNQEYIKLVINKFNSLNSQITEDEDLNLVDDDKSYLKVYKDKLKFLEIYVNVLNKNMNKLFDYDSTIIDEIANKDKDAAISYVEAQYSEYIDSDNSSLRDYFLYEIESEKLMIDILLRTDISKCIATDSIVANCEAEPSMTEEEALRMREIEDEMRIIVSTNIKYIISGCWDIYNMVNGVKNV